MRFFSNATSIPEIDMLNRIDGRQFPVPARVWYSRIFRLRVPTSQGRRCVSKDPVESIFAFSTTINRRGISRSFFPNVYISRFRTHRVHWTELKNCIHRTPVFGCFSICRVHARPMKTKNSLSRSRRSVNAKLIKHRYRACGGVGQQQRRYTWTRTGVCWLSSVNTRFHCTGGRLGKRVNFLSRAEP